MKYKLIKDKTHEIQNHERQTRERQTPENLLNRQNKERQTHKIFLSADLAPSLY